MNAYVTPTATSTCIAWPRKLLNARKTLRNQRLTADYAANRRILEIVFLNCVLDGELSNLQ
jgi:hypothetical protein